MGRSVSAWGFWGDILNSPFPCWGVLCEDEAFYKFSNKQFTRTAVDIAERNVLVSRARSDAGEQWEGDAWGGRPSAHVMQEGSAARQIRQQPRPERRHLPASRACVCVWGGGKVKRT